MTSARLLLVLLLQQSLHPREPSAQEPAPPVYTAAQLHCTRFAETAHSEIETETARGSVAATADRDGIWSFRARDTVGGIALESWYDSLSLRRRTGDAEIAADTDGLIGGRYRGLLGASGSFVEAARPFLPDEVAEVADLTGAARDLFPPLPAGALGAGEVWKGKGLELTRLSDTTVAGQGLIRFRLASRSVAIETVPHGDTVPIPVRQTTVERGEIYWSPSAGLVRRTRDITVDATIPAGGRVRQPARSRVVQRIQLTRLSPQPDCR